MKKFLITVAILTTNIIAADDNSLQTERKKVRPTRIVKSDSELMINKKRIFPTPPVSAADANALLKLSDPLEAARWNTLLQGKDIEAKVISPSHLNSPEKWKEREKKIKKVLEIFSQVNSKQALQKQ